MTGRAKIFQFALAFLALAMSGCSNLGTRPQSTLRVMTYNIHHGEGVDGKLDLERIAKLIRDHKVDLVALQEVDRNAERTGRRDMPAELAKLTGLTNYAFGANIPLQGGEYGNAILSRFPILSWTNHLLPQIVPGEQRGLLESKITTPIGKITFCSTHLDHRKGDADRMAGVERICEIFGHRNSSVVIVAGDFNAPPENRVFAPMKGRFADAWSGVQSGGFTIPSESPRNRIDYIWIPQQHYQVADAKVINSIASDHLPVLIELKSDLQAR